MRKPIFLLVAFVVAAAGLLTYFAFDSSAGQAGSPGHIASALGIAEVQGRDVFVEVSVLVPEGQSAGAATAAALAAQGARPFDSAAFESAAFTLTGLVWDVLPVVQYYNASNEPSGIDGETALTNTHSMWSGIATSAFDINYGGPTNRCPSLVDECSGPQQLDGFNDVTFLAIKGPCNAVFGCTIGVTWYDIVSDEADMAVTTKIAWNDGCQDLPGSLDVQTVIGHENGHVAGLGHSTDPNSIMFTPYSDFQCALGNDDIAGVSALYPAGTPTDTPAATPSPTVTVTPDGPTPTPTPTPDGDTGFCPPGHQRRGLC